VLRLVLGDFGDQPVDLGLGTVIATARPLGQHSHPEAAKQHV
jgi:hypothetical protein